jgi:cellulose synthase/poly-beta-1,6-N-acetylglucosamine synthase-like glycosyltransferase
VVSAAFGAEPRVHLLRKPNGGKASALNLALHQAQGTVIVAQDADTLLAPDAIARLARHFTDPQVGAVCGNVRVGNVRNVLTRWQALEYVTSQNFDRRAYDLLNCITVVPGAVGAWRRDTVLALGGYASDTLAEDTDLTWTMRQAGWRILNDSTAVAYTEAPDQMRSLARQRFRWTFGTLQNLCKHLPALFRYGAFGWIALPSLWLYQILLPAVSPIMDVMIIWAIFGGHLRQFALYYAVMVGIEFVGAVLALWMDRGRWGLLPWLFLQRFVYRQLIYMVILKSMVAAVRGGTVHWGKLDRRGSWAPPEPSAD